MRIAVVAIGLFVLAGCAATGEKKMVNEPAADGTGNFATAVVDFGIVCSDVAKSREFYRDALGFAEVPGFDVPAEMGRESGLSDDKPFHVHIMKLPASTGSGQADADHATSVKLMQFYGTPGAPINNDFIHSSYGVRYLTIYVKDMNAALRRAAERGVRPIAHGPTLVPKYLGEGIYIAILRDPDGNMVELVGPKKQRASASVGAGGPARRRR